MVQTSTPWVTPNRGMGPPWGAFCQITLTSCSIHCNASISWCTYHTIRIAFVTVVVRCKSETVSADKTEVDKQTNAVFVQLLVALFWCLAAACSLSLIYGLYGTANGYVHLSDTVRSFYAAVHRTAWAVGVAWVIFACVTGNGGEFVLVGISSFTWASTSRLL